MLFDDEEFDPYDDVTNTESTPEGLKEPHQSGLMIGHEDIETQLINLVNGDKMPHAVIFSGEEGIGKFTMAQRLARALLVHGVEDTNQDNLFGGDDVQRTLKDLEVGSDHPIYSKVASKGHPDLLTIERPVDSKTQKRKNEINVETARKVAPFLRMTSADGGWRIVIINDADTMNRNAQNSILKILEEPPKNTVLILVCNRLGAMIPTIRSRCRVMNFNSLSPENFNRLLTMEYGDSFSTQEKELLLTFSNQSVGQAKNIIDKNSIETIQSCLDLLAHWPNISNQEIHNLSETVGRAGQDHAYRMAEKTILTSFEKIISAKARETSLPAPFNMAGLENILSQLNGDSLITIYQELKETLAQGRYANLDKRLVIINVFNRIKSLT